MTRLGQALLLIRPTARALQWQPMLWASGLAIAYVWIDAPGKYLEQRVTILRLAAVLVCMGAAFALDDATEDTISHVPAPLLMRRLLRVLLLLPLVGATWWFLLTLAGSITPRDGGPVPRSDLTLEAGTLLALALVAACIGARLTSDRLGGIAAAPIMLGLVAAAAFLPGDYKLIVGPGDPRWVEVHQNWRIGLGLAVAAFVYLNRSPGTYRPMSRLRAVRPASRPV